MNAPAWVRRTYNHTLRQLTDFSEAAGTVDARIEWRDGQAVVQYGTGSFMLRDLGDLCDRPEVADLAALGLAIVSMSTNHEVRFDGPVSQSMARQIDELAYASRILMMPRIAPLRLVLQNVVPDPQPVESSAKVICLSGGVDSTAAAILASRDLGFTHGLLIAGADYPSAREPGYRQLAERVRASADLLGLTLVEVETDIRHGPFRWEMLHGFCMAMCQHFLAGRFAGGGIASDNTGFQDLVRHPWGSSAALVTALGTRQFPIRAIGGGLDRVQKLRLIADTDAELLNNISVCWKDTAIGGNCGVCGKCVRTRLNYICAGLDEASAFPTEVPVAELFARTKLPRRETDMRGYFVRNSEILRHLPDGPLREIAAAHDAELRARLTPMD